MSDPRSAARIQIQAGLNHIYYYF
eukprot:SAG11_NODE_1758_length_4306_cov_2.946993_1_plen_23_part_10